MLIRARLETKKTSSQEKMRTNSRKRVIQTLLLSKRRIENLKSQSKVKKNIKHKIKGRR
jgi:hypothetical protein